MRWRFETIASISALTLSLCGVVTSIVQTRVMMQQQRATLWPHLAHTVSNAERAGECHFELQNSGTGPATIRFVDITWRSIHFETMRDAVEAMRTLRASSQPVDVDLNVITSWVTKRTLRPGEAARWLALSGKSAPQVCEWLFAEDIAVRIVYSSVYDECWELSDEGTRQLPCPP